MRTIVCVLIALVLSAMPVFAKRHHVTIHKAPPAPKAGVVIAVIPVIGMFYDLQRRTSCQGDTLGVGGAGFDTAPKTGNFLIPAVYRSGCQAQPK